MNKKAVKITKIFFIVLACLVALVTLFPAALFILLLLLGPVIHLVFFPLYITFSFMDILFPAITASAFVSILIAASLKYKTNLKLLFIALISVAAFWFVYFPTAQYFGESLIRNVAKEKYNQEAMGVSLNLKGWYKIGPSDFMGFPGHDRYLGSAHGYIYVDSCKSNWSFFERDFIKTRYCDNALNP